MSVALALGAAHHAQSQTWTVDDDGPADFQTIASAIAAVSPGDRLLVQSGDYAAFSLNKRLSILGPAAGPKPIVHGRSAVLGGAREFTLAGLRFDGMDVSSVQGRGVIDDCSFFETDPYLQTLTASSCKQLLISRCEIGFGANCSLLGADGSGLRAFDSHLVIVSSRLTGKKGCDHPQYKYGNGGHGISATQSFVLVAGSDVQGGLPGATCGAFGCTGCCYGAGGVGIRVDQGSVAIVRGSGQEIKSISALDAGTLVAWSGVLVSLGVFASGNAQAWHVDQEPYITVVGGDEAGDVRRLSVFGPAGAPGVVWASLAPAFLDLPHSPESIWIDPQALSFSKAFVTLGEGQPVTHSWTVPPLAGIEGATLHFQGLFPQLESALAHGQMFVTNPTTLVLRF
jgi:hypothetical protein